MNINKSNLSFGYKLMSDLFSKTAGNKTGFSVSQDKTSVQYRNRYADINEVKVNTQGLTGMSIHGKDPSEYQQSIYISEEGKQKIFDMTKSEFIQNNGILQGDTTARTEVFSEYLRTVPEEDRLKAAWTLQQLEYQYRTEFVSAIKQSNPDWDLGKPFDSRVLSDFTISNIGEAVDQEKHRELNMRI